MDGEQYDIVGGCDDDCWRAWESEGGIIVGKSFQPGWGAVFENQFPGVYECVREDDIEVTYILLLGVISLLTIQ